MTLIPGLEHELERAAQRLYGSKRRSRAWARWRLPAVGVTIIALLAFAITEVDLGSQTPSATAAQRVLQQAAHVAASGLGSSRLGPGQAWYTNRITMRVSPWSPSSRAGWVSTTVTPSTRAAIEDRSGLQSWTLRNGNSRGRGRAVGHEQFLGSRAERRIWAARHDPNAVTHVIAFATTQTDGFQAVGLHLTYQQVLEFPTDPSQVLRYIQADSAAAEFANATELLTQVPLLPAARAAVYRALASIPGIHYLGAVKDPLGRHGVAIAVNTAEPIKFLARGPVTTPPPKPRSGSLKSELIFDPNTSTLLARQTLLTQPTHIPGAPKPLITGWTAYQTSKTVPASQAPSAKQLHLKPAPPA